MSNQLLPCPFCGGTDVHMRELGIVHIERFAQCYTCELSVPLDAWNRRASQPAAGEPIGKVELFGINMTYVEWRERKMPPLGTELYAAPRAAAPVAAGEPVAEFFVEFATLRRAMSIYGLSAPESNHELGSQMERYAIRVIEAVAKLPFPYPPAAAHGDEAVRKPSWKDEHEAFKSWARSRITPLKLDLDEVGLFYDEVAGVAHDAWHARAAMRAQGDGE